MVLKVNKALWLNPHGAFSVSAARRENLRDCYYKSCNGNYLLTSFVAVSATSSYFIGE